MALIEFLDEESKEEGIRCLLGSGGKYSIFGRDNEAYFFVDVLALGELDDKNIGYRLFDDPADANLRKDNMEAFRKFERQLTEDALPPRGYVEVKFNISEPLEDSAKEILHRYGSTETRIEKGSIILPGSEESTESSRIVSSLCAS